VPPKKDKDVKDGKTKGGLKEEDDDAPAKKPVVTPAVKPA